MQVPDEDRRKIGVYLGLGWGYALTVLVFVGVGAALDRWLGATPIFTVLGVFIGGAAGFYSLVRRVRAIEKGEDLKKQENDGSSEPLGKAPDTK